MSYPIIIVKDRYGGTYSKGKWTAFNTNKPPSFIDEDDVSCFNGWFDFYENKAVFGVGKTPDEAHRNLLERIDEADD